MKKTFCSIFLCGALVGCVTNPAQPAATFNTVNSAAISWQLVLDSIKAGEDSGLITKAEVTPFDPVLDGVAAAFASYQKNPTPEAGMALTNAVGAALPQIAPLLTKAKPSAAVAKATTKGA